jgi:hypothetical protein
MAKLTIIIEEAICEETKKGVTQVLTDYDPQDAPSPILGSLGEWFSENLPPMIAEIYGSNRVEEIPDAENVDLEKLWEEKKASILSTSH